MSNQYAVSNNSSFDIKVLAGTALAGLTMKLLFSQDESENGMTGPASAAVWGYGTVLLSLLGILIVSFALTSKDNMTSGIMQFLKGLISGSLPIVLMVVIITWLLSLSINYYTRINKGEVAPEYKGFSTASTIVVSIQLVVLLKAMYDVTKSSQTLRSGAPVASKMFSAMAGQLTTFSYVLAFINIVLAGAMQVILAFFSTDG